MLDKLLLTWIYSLSFFAGMLNAVAVYHMSTTVSHFTGIITKLSISIALKDMDSALVAFALIFSFFLGNFLSGLITNERGFNLTKRYGLILIAIGATLLIWNIVFDQSSFVFLLYLPFMMGMQNGLVVSYKGVIIRTTHMSGNITDFGVYMGYYLRGKKESLFTGLIPFFSIIFFIIGGIFGSMIFLKISYHFFSFAAIAYILIGTFYFFIRKHYSI